jgi:hypothetical protein
MNGKRGISNAQAKALGDFFSVEPNLFVSMGLTIENGGGQKST